MFKQLKFELIFWISGFLVLLNIDPAIHHFTLCPLENLGFSWCPGCGLGRSIAFLFHGNIQESINQHWFGIPALAIILHRIFQLSKQQFTNFSKSSLKECIKI
ncbi:MAG: DUF2752 domain-containing protein [Daejeonella sp.]